MIKKINLTNEIDSFNNNGFIIFDKFLLEENIEILKNRFDDLFDGKFENTIEPDEWNWKKNLVIQEQQDKYVMFGSVIISLER